MIIGNGLIAQAFRPYFQDDPDVLVFASGVSNSRERRADEFARERNLLDEALRRRLPTVYFSTCSVHDPELSRSPYVQHKVELEAMVRERAPVSTILRLPQVVGSTPNPHTLTNYLHAQIASGDRFQVWVNARRNLIDVADVAAIGNYLVHQHKVDNLTVNIACPFGVNVLDLVRMFEQTMGRPANCELVEAGAGYELDTTVAMAAARVLELPFPDDYVPRLIRKYYA